MQNLIDMCRVHDVKPRGVIHLGAHTGQEFPLYAAWNVPALWVEANPELIPALKDNVALRQSHLVVAGAACDRDDEFIPFYVASNGGSSSILRMKKHAQLYPEVTVEREISVRAVTVDEIIKRYFLEPRWYDFLNMDIQGAELLAIEGMTKQLGYLRWIYAEVNFDELYEGCTTFTPFTLILEKKGFKLAGLRQEEGAKGWGEALYVRR